MTPEFWAIIGIGAMLTVVVYDGLSRIIKRLNGIAQQLHDIRLGRRD